MSKRNPSVNEESLMSAHYHFQPEAEHVGGELFDALVGRLEAAVNDVDSVGLRIGDVFGHETAEPGEIRGDCEQRQRKNRMQKVNKIQRRTSTISPMMNSWHAPKYPKEFP